MLESIWIFPVLVSIMVPATFLLTYFLSVSNNHAQPYFPYISDTGSYPPESCVFGQLLNMGAVIIGLVIYFRHRQVAEFHRHAKQSKRSFLRCGTVFLWVGYASAFGLSMVGNFQQTNWLFAHMLGAFITFAFGLAYCWAQTIFTYKMLPVLHRPWVSHVRLLLSVVATVSFILMGSLGFNPFLDSTNRKNYSVDCGPHVWQLVFVTKGSKGYPAHVVTTFCEWMMSFVFMIYFLTYAVELRHAVLIAPKLLLTIEHSKLPNDYPQILCVSDSDQLLIQKHEVVAEPHSRKAPTQRQPNVSTRSSSADGKKSPKVQSVKEAPKVSAKRPGKSEGRAK